MLSLVPGLSFYGLSLATPAGGRERLGSPPSFPLMIANIPPIKPPSSSSLGKTSLPAAPPDAPGSAGAGVKVSMGLQRGEWGQTGGETMPAAP